VGVWGRGECVGGVGVGGWRWAIVETWAWPPLESAGGVWAPQAHRPGGPCSAVQCSDAVQCSAVMQYSVVQ
jgi:hypothetical protein